LNFCIPKCSFGLLNRLFALLKMLDIWGIGGYYVDGFGRREIEILDLSAIGG
jgi:hypothetical protein